MAEVISTEFQYKGATYSAQIMHIDGSISISVPHNELHPLFPNGRAVYSIDKGLELSSPELTEYEDLMIAILASLESSGALILNTKPPQKREEA